MRDLTFSILFFSIFITWTYGLGVPFLIREKLHKEPFKKLLAFGLCVFLLFFNFLLFRILKDINDPQNTQLNSHGGAWMLVAMVSYSIFTSTHEKLSIHFKRWWIAMLACLSIAFISLLVEHLYSGKGLSALTGPAKPKKLDSYMGVPLNSTKEDIHYALGEPIAVNQLVEKIPSDGKPYLKTTTVTDLRAFGIDFATYNDWIYNNTATEDVEVVFDHQTQKVKYVVCYASDLHRVIPNACEVNGVGLLKTEDETRKILGNPVEEVVKDGYKSMFYYNYNMAIQLFKKQVTKIQVYPQQ